MPTVTGYKDKLLENHTTENETLYQTISEGNIS